MSIKKDYLGLFGNLTRACFLGENFRFERSTYSLRPRLLGKYDALRVIEGNPGSEFDRLVKDLPTEFKTVARTELYRRRDGWVDKGEKNRQFREAELGGKPFIVPILSTPSVGIDTSESDWTFILIGCFEDAECGYQFLEKHLQLPKAKQPVELKWAKLNSDYRRTVLDRLQLILELSARAILVIKTNALSRPEEKKTDVFIKLIDGCFSGFESKWGKERMDLRQLFFDLTNDIPVHCDSDFSPLTTDKLVRHLVKTLAGNQSRFTPVHVGLKSEESHSIQVADIMCGAMKTLVGGNKEAEAGFTQLPFNNRLSGKGKDAKAYCWKSENKLQVPRAVNA